MLRYFARREPSWKLRSIVIGKRSLVSRIWWPHFYTFLGMYFVFCHEICFESILPNTEYVYAYMHFLMCAFTQSMPVCLCVCVCMIVCVCVCSSPVFPQGPNLPRHSLWAPRKHLEHWYPWLKIPLQDSRHTTVTSQSCWNEAKQEAGCDGNRCLVTHRTIMCVCVVCLWCTVCVVCVCVCCVEGVGCVVYVCVCVCVWVGECVTSAACCSRDRKWCCGRCACGTRGNYWCRSPGGCWSYGRREGERDTHFLRGLEPASRS